MSKASALQDKCFVIVGIFLLSMLSPLMDVTPPLESTTDALNSPNLSSSIVSIGSYPNSVVSNTSLTVPDGKSVVDLDLTIESNSLPNHVAYSIDTDNDFLSSSIASDVLVANNELKLGSTPGGTVASFTLLSSASSLTNNIADNCYYYGYDQGQEFTYTHQVGIIYMEYTSQNWGSETCIEYKEPGSSNFVLWKDYGDISSYQTYNSKTQPTNPVVFSSYGDYKFKIWDRANDGSHGGTLKIVQETINKNQGTWQSESLTLSDIGLDEQMAFGPLSLDAKIPGDSKVSMSIIDVADNRVISGFSSIEERYFDMSIIDWELYPEIAIKLDLFASSSGESPVVYGLHFEGKIHDSLETDITAEWNLQSCTWSTGQISGSGSAITNEYVSRSGFSIIKTNSVITGGGIIQYSLDSGQTWNNFDIQQTAKLATPHYSIHFKISGNSNWVLDQLSVELLRSSVAEGIEIDLLADNLPEWSMNYPGAGKIGLQNRFIDDSLSISKQATKSNGANFEFLLPILGVESLEFFVSSKGNFESPYFVIDIDSQNVISRNIPDVSSNQKVVLTNSEINQLNNALLQSTPYRDSNGLVMSKVELKLGSSLTEPTITVLGLNSQYEPKIDLSFDSNSKLLKQLNNLLNDLPSFQNSKEVKIPVRMKGTGSIKLTVESLSTIISIDPISINVANVSQTFTPSVDWIDVNTTFDFAPLGIFNPENHIKSNSWTIELNLVGNHQSSRLVCSAGLLPISGQESNSCYSTGVGLIWFDLGTSGSISMVETFSQLQINHRFKFPVEWDDEESILVSVNLISTTGPMLPIGKYFGLGSSQGVENDIEVKDWSIVGQNGIPSNIEYPYLKKGEPVDVQVSLGFEGDELTSPRTGHVLTRFLVEGNEFGSTTIVIDGLVSIPWVVPSLGDGVNLEIDVQPLRSQTVSYAVPRSADFGFDAISPQLLNVNVEEYDHLDISANNLLEFTLTDRPVLPTKAEIVLWKSWIDDLNQNGLVDSNEFHSYDLQKPTNMEQLEGVYSYNLDTLSAGEGSYIIGWINVADSAGNQMQNSGNISQPLFNLFIGEDSSPQLGSSELSWEYGYLPWLHPGENVIVELPVWDNNGITDIRNIEFDLSVNQPDSSTILWDRQTETCSSSTLYIEVISCNMQGDIYSGLFTNYGTFTIEFKFNWGFSQDDNIIRTPSLTLIDLNGQSTAIALTDLNWQYSGEMQVDRSSISYDITGNNNSDLGAWVKSRENISIFGDLKWLKSGRIVAQELELLYNLGQNQGTADYLDGQFEGTIIAPANSGNYPITISLRNPPNGATITQPEAPLLWFIVDGQAPYINNIQSPIPGQIIKEDNWENLPIEISLSEDKYLNEESIYLGWEVHNSGFGFSSSSIASGGGQIAIYGGKPYGDYIKGIYTVDLDSLISQEVRTQALELRIWINGSDMAGNEFGQVSDEIYAPFAVWKLEQQLPEYEFLQPAISSSSDVTVGEAIDISVNIKNSGKSDGVAQLRVERVESNGARTIIHTQDVMVKSGDTGDFEHRWVPDKSGSMWIEFVIVGSGITAQTSTFYADNGQSDGFFEGIAELNPVLLIVISILAISLIGLLIFGLRTPNNPNLRQMPQNKNYRRATRQMPQQPQQQQQYYANQQSILSPGDDPYR